MRYIQHLALVRTLIILSAFLLCGCSQPDPPSTSLPRAVGVDYRISFTKYFDGEGLVCQPFELFVAFDNNPEHERSVMFAEQSDDVVVAQTPSVIYIFYNELGLTHFGTSTRYSSDARILLCDVNVPFCAAERERLSKAGAKIVRICGRVRR